MRGLAPSRSILLFSSSLIALIFVLGFFKSVQSLFAGEPHLVYEDELSPEWENWSWGSEVDFDNNAFTKSGNSSVRLKLLTWGGFYLHSKSLLSLDNYSSLNFSIKASRNSEQLKLLVYAEDGSILNSFELADKGGNPAIDRFTDYSIPTSEIPSQIISGFAIQNSLDSAQEEIYIDSIYFEPKIKVPFLSSAIAPPNELAVFDGSLNPDWEDWSWGSANSFNETIIHESLAPWSGLYLHSKTVIDGSKYKALTFELLPEENNQIYKMVFYGDNNYPIGGFMDINNWNSNLTKDSWNRIVIPLESLGLSNISGFAIQDALDVVQPKVQIKNIKFVSSYELPTVTPNQINTLPENKSLTYGSNYEVKSGKIFNKGSEIILTGINWFGFETQNLVPHGLWARNYREMIQQIKSLGFNSVRLPFCPSALGGSQVSSVNYSINQDLVGLNSIEVMDKILSEFETNQIYFLLDHHRPDCKEISELWYTDSYSEEDWINDLTFVAKRYKDSQYFLGIDLKNEPHGAATWGKGNILTDWNLAAERAGSRILTQNPNILIFVEGIADSHNCSSNYGHVWGGNIEPVNCTPISQSAIPANKLVLSPHVYGPEIYMQNYFKDSEFPENMPGIWEKQFGFATKLDYAVVLGEWGGLYGTTGGDKKEVQFLDKLTDYVANKKMCNSFYWSLNPNSGDTGGILKDDWVTVWSEKMMLINKVKSACI